MPKKRTPKELQFETGRVLVGSCLKRLKEIPDASIDSVVTDPPYELGFMGKAWDASGVAYDVELWRQVLRVLKPGGHLLAFGGSRTYHRLACAVEDAGFEIRDQIMWVYGSGFPKSLDVSKAVDKMHGAERQVIGVGRGLVKGDGGRYKWNNGDDIGQSYAIDSVPATDDAKRWSGWGTALKPAHEPIVLARKPLDGTVAETVLAHGTGALNIEACRIRSNDGYEKKWDKLVSTNIGAGGQGNYISDGSQHRIDISANKPSGRWPANFIHDGSDEVLELFPEERQSGSAARFFYCAKASRAEREAGLDGDGTARRNHHPTVKPIALMRYLIRLVTPPGAVVLDPFLGSGTTAVSAILESCTWVGCEMTADYLPIIKSRVEWAEKQPKKLL
jgi:site-specific DNA-methyltransferase (adenine-specific)